MIAENNGVKDTGERAVKSMRFKPFVINGIPVQVMSQITVPFKIVRPTGNEQFDSAQTFFERGRRASSPAAGQPTPVHFARRIRSTNRRGQRRKRPLRRHLAGRDAVASGSLARQQPLCSFEKRRQDLPIRRRSRRRNPAHRLPGVRTHPCARYVPGKRLAHQARPSQRNKRHPCPHRLRESGGQIRRRAGKGFLV